MDKSPSNTNTSKFQEFTAWTKTQKEIIDSCKKESDGFAKARSDLIKKIEDLKLDESTKSHIKNLRNNQVLLDASPNQLLEECIEVRTQQLPLIKNQGYEKTY